MPLDARFQRDTSDDRCSLVANPTREASMHQPSARPVDDERLLRNIVAHLRQGGEKDAARAILACNLATRVATLRNDEGPDPRILVLRFSASRVTYEALTTDDSPLRALLDNAVHAVFPFDLFSGGNIEFSADRDDPHGEDQDTDNQCVAFRPTREYAGLRYRSESEIRVAQALDRAGVMYLPNCRARVGDDADARRNIEADFIVMLGGKWAVLEVDGRPWHEGNAARDHDRDRPFHFHGAAIVQRFDGDECFENPDGVVAKFLCLLKRR